MVRVAASGERVTSRHRRGAAVFVVADLVPGTSYTLKLWAANSLGESEPNYMRYYPAQPSPAQLRTTIKFSKRRLQIGSFLSWNVRIIRLTADVPACAEFDTGFTTVPIKLSGIK